MNEHSDGQHWYRGAKDTQPFFLARLISSKDTDAGPFYTTASFPWREESMRTLWEGRLLDKDGYQRAWKDMVDEWEGTILVGGNGRLFIFPKYTTSKPFSIRLLDINGDPKPEWQVRCVAWALRASTVSEPLAIVAAKNLIFVVHLRSKQLEGCIRGHGGDITSIAVNHLYPYLFCTSSKDTSTRLYDLSYKARQVTNNPPWPPSKRKSLAGPAFGLQMSQSEGNGFGRCTAVFVGGPSGGHMGAVFSVAFHPSALVIATCGMDRAVKIWRVPRSEEEKLERVDKPLFSTDLIHKSRVLSISWLSDDVLISCCAPAWMQQNDSRELHAEPGTIVIWRWLGWDRFFPANHTPQRILRPCFRDYHRSESFKILSSYSLPLITRQLHVCSPLVSLDTGSTPHDPLLLVPMGKTIRVLNITDFGSRKPPPFPLDDELIEQTRRLSINTPGERGETEEGEGTPKNSELPQGNPIPISAPPEALFQSIDGWEINVAHTESITNTSLPDIENCEMAFDGKVILGVGKKGTLYVWKLGRVDDTNS